MIKRYKVIWFDDEHLDRKFIKESAHLNGISLEGFTNAEEGIAELRNNIRLYDAALLDGIFYRTPKEKGTPTEDDAIGEVAQELIRLDNTKKLPWFILSGQDSFTKEKNKYAEAFKKGQVFDKLGDDDHYNLLWQSIKEEADKNLDTRIRHKYPNIMALCTDEYIGTSQWERIFKILENIEEPSSIVGSQDLLTPMRKIMEAIFSKLIELGIIPDGIRNNPGWINGSSLFLGNKHYEFTHSEVFIPPVISENIHRLLTITQDASHNEGSKLGVDAYISESSNTYLYQSALFLLLDILDWTKNFIDQNPVKANNLEKWNKVSAMKIHVEDTITGTVLRIADNGWGKFQPDSGGTLIGIPPTMVSSNKLIPNMPLKITVELSPDGTKTFIKTINIISK